VIKHHIMHMPGCAVTYSNSSTQSHIAKSCDKMKKQI